MDEESATPSPRDALVDKLHERIKELDCIYAILDMSINLEARIDEIMQHIVDRIPLGFQHPEHTCASVVINGKTTRTPNFKPCSRTIEAQIIAHKRTAGTLEVGYFGPFPSEGSPFLEEEERLIHAIASRIGMILHAGALTEALEKSERRYRALVENALVGIIQTTRAGELLYVNDTYLRMFGYGTPEEAVSMGAISRYRNSGDREVIVKMLQQNGKITNIEVECITKTGDSIFLLF